jgi:hypothetical protein
MSILAAILTPHTIAAYLALAVIAAFLGRRRRIGFWGFFFLSLMVTPFATLFFLFVCTPVKVKPPVKGKTSRPAKPDVKATATPDVKASV